MAHASAKRQHAGVTVEDVCVHAVPAAFALLMLIFLVPMIMSEPYGHSLVGATLDNGSKLFTMTSPYLGRVALTLGGFAAALYAVIQLIQRTSVYKQLFEGRLWPASISQRLA